MKEVSLKLVEFSDPKFYMQFGEICFRILCTFFPYTQYPYPNFNINTPYTFTHSLYTPLPTLYTLLCPPHTQPLYPLSIHPFAHHTPYPFTHSLYTLPLYPLSTLNNLSLHSLVYLHSLIQASLLLHQFQPSSNQMKRVCPVATLLPSSLVVRTPSPLHLS